VKTYGTQINAFLRLSEHLGIDVSQPLDEPDLCLVMSAYAECHKITTLPGFLAALNNYSRRM
jgi:hypothetical protein